MGTKIGSGGIPDRWLKYDPVGKEIDGTRFVPFKCPLDKAFFQRRKEVEDEDIFTINVLLAMADKAERKIGLVIDLTNTKRYYDPQELAQRGIEHYKLNCPGHEVDEREDIVQKFTQKVDRFLENCEPDVLIGVHCTHGLNRTGYLIGRYMIDRMGWGADQFIEKFEYCRGHPIERNTYKDKLRWAEMTKADRLSLSQGLRN